MGVLGLGERPLVTPLEGGVSSDIRLVEIGGRRLCIKRALPRLKVAQLWEAPVERNGFEWAWFATVAAICPEAVPALVGQDEAAGLFVMEYLPPESHRLWKSELRDGVAETALASPSSTTPLPGAPTSQRGSRPTSASMRSGSSRISSPPGAPIRTAREFS